MHLIFEVFGKPQIFDIINIFTLTGIVNSQVSHAEFGSKGFLLKTSDGTIKLVSIIIISYIKCYF